MFVRPFQPSTKQRQQAKQAKVQPPDIGPAAHPSHKGLQEACSKLTENPTVAVCGTHVHTQYYDQSASQHACSKFANKQVTGIAAV
jgi:hypothetical protein